MKKHTRFALLISLLSSLQILAAPSVSTLSPASGTTVGTFTSLSVTFSEPVTGIESTDLEINNENALIMSGSGAGPYIFTFTQPPAGLISVSWVGDHGITGIGTGDFAPPGGYTFTLTDNIAPTIGKIATSQTSDGTLDDIAPTPGSTVGALTQAIVRFSEPVTGVNASDLLIAGTPASAMTGSGAGPYVFTFPAQAAGNVAFTWAAGHGITDSSANAFAGGTWSVTVAASAGNVIINEFLAANATGLTDENTDQEDWIELYNNGATSVNLLGWALTDDADEPRKWILPARTLAAGSYLVIYASGKNRKPASGNLHTNFKINENGGYLALFGPASPTAAATQFPFNYAAGATEEFPPQRYDYSFSQIAGPAYRYHTPPTPNAVNGASTLTAVAANPHASVSRGFFNEAFDLVLSTPTAGATIRYTLDGTVPTATSTAYSAPIAVTATTVLRAVTFATDTVPSETITHSYIFLDNVFAQPSPPYFTATTPSNPQPPSVGGVALPIHWGTASNFQNTAAATSGYVPFNNLPASNSIPADYGMDPKIWNDPNKYDDTGAINNTTGKTNLERMKTALREIPILSVVMKSDDMFSATGLYPNSSELINPKPELSKPCSLEMLLPDGTTGFAIHCGIDLHGNASRAPYKNPKHGFTLKFKGDYGSGKLDYRLFPDSPVKQFDKLILRADFNSSWRHQDNTVQRPKGNRIRDAWSKDSFRDMGRIAGHHRYVNLFINGIYWGSYDLAEDQNDEFGADYFGGNNTDYDLIEQDILKAGTATAYNAMKTIASPIDNTKYEQMKGYLDIPWFADYMLFHYFVGHEDWGAAIGKNWYAVRNAKNNGTFKYLPWDMENLLYSETVNRVTGATAPPSGLQPKLITNPQYLLDFADRVHRHMISPDGALLPAANITRLNKWAAIMNAGQQALESARWGDYRRDVHRYTVTSGIVYTWNGKWYESNATQTSTTHWLAEQTRLTSTYFPARTNNVLGQFRTAGLYPNVNAPEIRNVTTNLPIASQLISEGFQIKLTNVATLPAGTSNATTFYYTTNGTDPRVYYTGTVSPSATAAAPESLLSFNETTTLKVRAHNGTTWSALNEQTFTIGFTPQTVKITEIHYRPTAAQGGIASEFIELQNTGTSDVNMSGWFMDGVNFIFPQGFNLGPGDRVVIASNENPNTFTALYPGVSVLGYFGGDLDNNGERLALLNAAGATIFSVDYDDTLPWPTTPDGGGYTLEIVDPSGNPNSAANWKPSNVLAGTPGTANGAPAAQTISINEFLAINGGAYTTSGQNPGYIELTNTSATPANLQGWTITYANNNYTLPAGTTINGNSRLLIHITTAPLPGPVITTPLPTQTGFILLRNATGDRVDGIQYGPQIPNYSFSKIGAGFTLSNPTPGTANTAAATASQTSLRINEWHSNPLPGHDDWIEITNPHPTLPLTLTDLYIGANGERLPLRAPAAIAPGGYVQLYCNRGGDDGNDIGFNIPSTGTTLTLTEANGTQFESIAAIAQNEGASHGRLPNATGTATALPYPSPALANYTALTAQPQINEILYLNNDGHNAPWGARPAWIELKNPTATNLSLAGWKLRHPDIATHTWTFPPGVTLPAGGYLAIWSGGSALGSTTNSLHLNYAGTTLGTQFLTDAVELVNPVGQIVDRIRFGSENQLPDKSIGRLNDGTWTLLTTPTRAAANAAAATLGPVSAVKINEWSTHIELYNTSALPVAIGGLYLADEPSEIGKRKGVIPPLSFLPGLGYGALSDNTLGFSVDNDGEFLRLALSDGTKLDSVSFGIINAAASQALGRSPDGGTTIASNAATFGLANIQGTTPGITAILRPYTILAGSPLSIALTTVNTSSYQWHLNGVPIPGATSAGYGKSSAATADDGIYTCVLSGPGGTITSPPIAVTVLHTYATWAASWGIAGAPPTGDNDADGINNLAEFLANTSPVSAASIAERTSQQAVVSIETSSGTPSVFALDFRLNRRAAFNSLAGQFSTDLSSWTFPTPLTSQLLTTHANGDQQWRLRYTIPANTPAAHLRLQISE